MIFYNIPIGKFRFSYTNFKEFILLYIGIFIFGGYKFKSDKKSPLIIDCGSHIGVSVLGFKNQYPQSKIICFEPNPQTFKVLERNIKQNKLKDVKLINAAVSDKVGKVDFYINLRNTWSWGDSTAKSWFIRDKYKKIKVKSVRLSRYLKSQVDLLKLNIEGSETKVLKEIEGKLRNVKELLLHYHGESTNPENNLDDIFEILDKASFSYQIRQLRNFGLPKKVTKSTINKKEPYFLFIKARKTCK